MEYVRNCPKCGKELKTTNKYYFNKAVLSNSPCLSCSQKGKIITEEHRQNMKLNHADVRGEKNPFYKKKHSDETKKKISDLVKEKMSSEELRKSISERQKEYYKTHDNPFKGKKHSDKTKNTLSEIAKKRMQDESVRKLLSEKSKEWHKDNKNPFKGQRHSSESRRKQRISAINRIQIRKYNGNVITPNYNLKEAEYFERIEKEMNLNGVYVGKTGTQYQIKHLGYFPDFYDSETNIVIEYDEKHHYIDVYNNVLREKDIRRQNEIIRELGCRMYRYNETIDMLYEVFAQ
jgi:very-short-patch-repair endonuclease